MNVTGALALLLQHKLNNKPLQQGVINNLVKGVGGKGARSEPDAGQERAGNKDRGREATVLNFVL